MKIYIHKHTKVLRSENDYIHMTSKEQEQFEIYQIEDDIKPNGVFPCEEDPVIGDY